MKAKKGQSGMNAAMLVAILAALIVIYIIFLPSDERQDLIGENDTDRDGDGSVDKEILIEDKEIIMEVIGEDEIEHDLPSVSLFSRTEASVLKQENSIYVKNGLFDQEPRSIEFNIEDADNTKNMLISFDAKKSKGRLMMSLNGYEIYNNEIDKVNVDPIRVSNDYIAARNTLDLSVSGVGAAFWRTNEYLIEDFKITADLTDTRTQESVTTFIISDTEKSNIEAAELRFLPDCEQKNIDVLEIMINKNIIYSSVPDCGLAYPLDFSPMYLLRGENKLTFKSDTGRFLIDQVRITTDLKDQPSYTYFFELEQDDIEDIEENRKDLNLTFYFADDEEEKEAEIIINGARARFMRHHTDAQWSLSLSEELLEAGSNSLKILPEKRLEVRRLLLELEEN